MMYRIGSNRGPGLYFLLACHFLPCLSLGQASGKYVHKHKYIILDSYPWNSYKICRYYAITVL